MKSKIHIIRFFHTKTPLLCIFAGETAKLAFFFELAKAPKTANLLESMIMVLSLFCVPAIGLLSDKHCRKKTLVSVMVVGFLALVALISEGFIASFLQGIVGSAVVPIARAMYLDIQADPKKNWKISMAAVETVIIQAAAWSFSALYIESNFTHISMLLFLIGIFFLIPLKDKKDADQKHIKHEISSVRKRYLEGYAWQVLIAFFLYDCAFQLPNYYSEAFFTHILFSKILALVGSGILIGSSIIWILIAIYHTKLASISRARNCIYKGLIVTSVGMFLVYFLPFFEAGFLHSVEVNEMTFFYFCCISGMLLALVFVYFGNMVRVHERGLLFSILEEVETLAESVVPLFIFYLPAVLTNTPFIIIIGLGFLCLFKIPKRRKLFNKSLNF
ncbi:hypothetical protein [Candidatus Neptunochlamydia vexilliferae]|uniref:MFS transporter n=1 Tax=Candidatus Neptunichlamydia vexilliferae TaxID=1651774 RepID=A0ABS0B106_9BACT|nr:hypothetical protein [Candidatus Neptunochlamydia vexilliferae]MBF5060074.1 hypothetical protein [Candidatus Neptunochlamydia vexilliferae]